MSYRRLTRHSVFALLLGLAASAHAVDVPIQVVPLVPSDAIAAWNPGVITVGVPLSDDLGIRDVSQLGFRGSPAAQFRVLQRDVHSGNIRWVQVHFLALDAQADYALVNGAGTFGGAPLAREIDGAIHVDTGAAEFHLGSAGFRFLDVVSLQGRPVAGSRLIHEVTRSKAGGDNLPLQESEAVPAPSRGGLVVLANGQRFESALDTEATLTLEENGPVRAVIRCSGILRNAAGERHLGYTVRLVFDRHATACRAFVTLRNAEQSSVSAKHFDAAWLELPLAPDSERRIRTWMNGEPLSQILSAEQTAVVYQADNDQLRTGRTSRIVGDLCLDDGVDLQLGDQEFVSLGNTGNAVDGLLQVVGHSGSVLAGMRDMAAQFPSGFQVEDGLLSIEMFSRHNSHKNLLFAWGAHETREMVFDFASGGDPRARDVVASKSTHERMLQVLQAPWIGRCSFEHYRDSGAVFDETRLVSIEEERRFFAEQGEEWSLEDLRQSDLEYERQYSFRTTGGGNQFDQDLTRLIDFLRGNHTGRFLQARLNVLWKADQAVYHSDDFDMATYQNGISDVDAPDPDTFHGKGAGSIFDDEHPHWPSMILYYWLTGDERVREAIEDYGEYRRFRAGHPYWGAIHGGALNHFRLWSRAYRDMALLYEFTGQERYLESLRVMTRILTETVEVANGRGRNLQRGYFYFGDPEDPRRRIHLFFLTEIHPIAVREALRVLPEDDPLREALRDHLTGLAWFALREAQVDADAVGYPYGYYAAEVNSETGSRGDQTGLLLVHGYEQTGNPEFLERARRLTWRVLEYQHELRGSELSTHVRIHSWLHRGRNAVDLIEPRVERHVDGSATLHWRVPEGARRYVIKYGRKRLVPNLDFDQVTRTYRIDPLHAMNFWAAHNLRDEPRPLPAGREQEWRTPVLPEGDWSFAIQVFREARSTEGLDVEQFDVSADGDAVALQWKMHPSTRRSIVSVSVERASRASGPWTTVSRSPFRPEDAAAFEDESAVADEVYFYRLRLEALDGSRSWSRPVQVRTPQRHGSLELLSPRDPPDGDAVSIRYRLAQAAPSVLLSIFDVRGRRLCRLPQGRRVAGAHEISWDRRDTNGSRVRRGMVFLQLQAGEQSRTHKLLLR